MWYFRWHVANALFGLALAIAPRGSARDALIFHMDRFNLHIRDVIAEGK